MKNSRVAITLSHDCFGSKTGAMNFRSIWKIIKPRVRFLTLFSIVVCQHGVAQDYNRAIDSLMEVLKTAKEDSNKVNTLNMLSRRIWNAYPNGGPKAYAEKALALAQRLNFKRGMSLAYYNMGLCCEIEDNFSEALKNYRASLKIDEEIGNKHGLADTYIQFGLIHRSWGDYPQTLKYFLAALKNFEEIGSKGGIAEAYLKIGYVYATQNNYAEARNYFFKSHKILQDVDDKDGLADCYNQLAAIYVHERDYSEALRWFLGALKLRKQTGYKAALAASYGNIGDVYGYQGNYHEALRNNQIALKIVEEIRDNHEISLCQKGVGKAYLGLGKYTEARKYLTNSLALSEERGDKENIIEVYEWLSKLDSATRNYHNALAEYKLYAAYKDSLMNERNGKQITQLKEQYESEKKDKEIALLNKEKAIQTLNLKKEKQAKNYFIAGLVLVAILGFFAYRNYHNRQKLKLLTLRNKIASDLHDDVGSTLSSISIFSQMAQEQSIETIPLLETIGESSRKMLDAMADIVWTVKPENDQFEKIIMRMRSFAFELLGAKKIDFEFIADEDVTKINLPMEVRKNLYLIFKEATNNLVKYAQANKAKFAITGEKNNLMMMIRDNGKGFDVNNISEGNGLKNMKRRAEEIGAKLVIDSFPGNGTTIQLSVAV